LSIPQGAGEYKDSDHPENGCDSSDKDHGNCQEVFRDRVESSHIHLYVRAGTYTLNGSFDVAVVNNALLVNLTKVETPDKIAIATDFGNIKFVASTLGFLAGGVPGVLIVKKAGDSVEDRLTDMASSRATEKINSFHGQWSVKVPQ
jgi:hypothetical protein